jgi:hypothetical protein
VWILRQPRYVSCAQGRVCDLTRFVCQEFADSVEVPFIETSAKTATNVEETFVMMARAIKNRLSQSLENPCE